MGIIYKIVGSLRKKKLNKIKITIPSKYHSPESYLRELCHEGIASKYHFNSLEKQTSCKTSKKNVTARLKEELNIISELSLTEYFLVVYKLVQYAKEQHILLGPGRWHDGCSLVLYILSITDIDPIAFNLSYSRKLKPLLKNKSIMYVSIDVSIENRKVLIDYLEKLYPIYDIPETASVMIGDWEFPIWRPVIIGNEEDSEIIKNIIATKEVNKQHSAFSARDIPSINIVGSGYISLIEKVYLKVHGKAFPFNGYAITENDKNAYRLIQNRQLKYIYALEDNPALKYSMNKEIDELLDIAYLIALGHYERYFYQDCFSDNIERKSFWYPPEELFGGLLIETNGLCIYDQQLIQSIGKYLKTTDIKADFFRIKMTKGRQELVYKQFIDLAVKAEHSEYEANSVWNTYQVLARRAVSKSHVIGEAKIAYWMAYIKSNYPDIFNETIPLSSHRKINNAQVKKDIRLRQRLRQRF